MFIKIVLNYRIILKKFKILNNQKNTIISKNKIQKFKFEFHRIHNLML